MLHKDKILSLRDLALEHLPKVREQRDLMSKHGRIVALQAVAGGPLKTAYNAASTAIELRAAALLNLVHKHPDTTTEVLYPSVDDMGAALQAILLDDARKMQPEIEAFMLEDARLLCELSGAPLPQWMVGIDQQSAPAQSSATVKPLQRSAAQDAAVLNQITRMGYDPLALPQNPSGKRGVKAEVRDALSRDLLFIGPTVFDKAWERLSASGEIVIRK